MDLPLTHVVSRYRDDLATKGIEVAHPADPFSDADWRSALEAAYPQPLSRHAADTISWRRNRPTRRHRRLVFRSPILPFVQDNLVTIEAAATCLLGERRPDRPRLREQLVGPDRDAVVRPIVVLLQQSAVQFQLAVPPQPIALAGIRLAFHGPFEREGFSFWLIKVRLPMPLSAHVRCSGVTPSATGQCSCHDCGITCSI